MRLKKITATILSAIIMFGLIPGITSFADTEPVTNVEITVDPAYVRYVFARNDLSNWDIAFDLWPDYQYTCVYKPEDIASSITVTPSDSTVITPDNGIGSCTKIIYSNENDRSNPGYDYFYIAYDQDRDYSLYNAGDSLTISINGHRLSMQPVDDEIRHRYSSEEIPGCTVTIGAYYGYAFQICFTEEFVSAIDMFRLYNPNSGEHFYTASAGERDFLINLGWQDEGIGWHAPAFSNTPVYRLYNPYGGEHHYTTNLGERNNLIAIGWEDEGIGWYSDDGRSVPLYRQYNPNAYSNNHNYTTSAGENEWLVSIGWQAEGIGWYGVG